MMNTFVSNNKCILGIIPDTSNRYRNVHSLTNYDKYNDITVSRDPVVAAVVKWSIVVLAVVIVMSMVHSFGFITPWETGSSIAVDAGSIVYISGNDVMISIVEGSDTDKISSLSLYFEKSGDKVNIPDVQPTLSSGEPIRIEGMANGYKNEDNIILEAEFDGGTTKVLSKTHIQFS